MGQTMENYYQILELQDFSNFEDIKPAYRKMAMKYHPDKHENNELKHLSEEKFRQINEAYSNLDTEEKKERYDRQLKNYYRNGKKSYSEPETDSGPDPEPEPEENYQYEEPNYDYTYEEESYNTKDDLVKCYQHPNEIAEQICPECKKAYCAECMNANAYNMCDACLSEMRHTIKRDVKENVLKVILISVLMALALIGIRNLYSAVTLGLVSIVIVLNNRAIKYKWQDSIKPFVSKIIILVIHIIVLTIKLPGTLFILYRNLYITLKNYKFFNDKPNKLAITSVLVSKLGLVTALVFTLVVNTESALPSFSIDKQIENHTETILHIEVNTLNEKGVKGTYIEHVKSPLIPYLPEGTYYDGSTIIIYKEDDKYYLDLSAQWKPFNGKEKTLEYTEELTDVTHIKFDVCNKYVQVYTSETDHKGIDELTNLSYIELKDNYKINISIE